MTPEAGEKYAKDSHTPLAEQVTTLTSVWLILCDTCVGRECYDLF